MQQQQQCAVGSQGNPKSLGLSALRKIKNMEIATKPPRLKVTQIYDIQSIIFYLSSCLGALVAEKTLFGVDSVLSHK